MDADLGNKIVVSKDKLNQLASDLVLTFFPQCNVYHLLSLAFITVTKYSNKHRQMSTRSRMTATCAYLDDLITYLIDSVVITKEMGDKLREKLDLIADEIPSILEAYLYVSGGLDTKITNNSKKHRHCDIL
jgi:hypothetical protein